MTQRAYGEAKNLLLATLSSEYQHPKVVIAVDQDVDIFNPAELMWALATRVDPQKDVTIIGGGICGLGTALLLGSLWACRLALVSAIPVVIRTALEDNMLQVELPGYKEYTQAVRYRLIPGVS